MVIVASCVSWKCKETDHQPDQDQQDDAENDASPQTCLHRCDKSAKTRSPLTCLPWKDAAAGSGRQMDRFKRPTSSQHGSGCRTRPPPRHRPQVWPARRSEIPGRTPPQGNRDHRRQRSQATSSRHLWQVKHDSCPTRRRHPMATGTLRQATAAKQQRPRKPNAEPCGAFVAGSRLGPRQPQEPGHQQRGTYGREGQAAGKRARASSPGPRPRLISASLWPGPRS